jgi:alpha-1,2-mannosyltransferase
MTWWMRFDHFLNPRRLTYAWIAGGVLWGAWLLSIILGPGTMDLAGQVLGTDYLQFYAAGVTLRDGHSAELYNFEYQSQLEQTIAGPGLTSFHAFITPPFLAWLYEPFAFLPYTWSFVVWSLLSFVFLWGSIRLLSIEKPKNTLLWSLTWFPIFAAISFGQNSLLSLFLFSLTYWLWQKDKHFEAGLVSSLILFKPQLILGVGLLWLLEWRKSWKSLLGLLFGGSTLAALCFWLLPEASRSYIDLALNFFPGMMYQDQFPLWHMHSLRSFWALLLPGQESWVEILALILSLTGIVGFILFWRWHTRYKKLIFAAAILLTIWITPHAMIYDWTILLIPAILLWQEFAQIKPFWKSLFALTWVATFISGPFTLMQLKIFPIAIQISVPIYAFLLVVAGLQINHKHPESEYLGQVARSKFDAL